MVADGVLDAYWEFGLSIWDVAAGILLVEEAGGRVSTHDGSTLTEDDVSPLATNDLLHEQMMNTLSKGFSR